MSLKVDQLTKKFGSQVAVNAISFEARQGEILGFLGPNGAGKSTTMKIATAYLPPSSGSVQVCGKDVVDDSLAVRKLIGYLPEHNPLYLDMYVREYLEFIGSMYKLSGQALRQRVHEMVNLCGLGLEQRKLIGSLSKGYRQRVGLAQALIHDPRVLILDEPTTGLDPNQIVEIRKLIKELGKEKIRVAANFEITTAQYFANKYPERIQMLWTRENEKYKQKWDYAFFGTRGMPKQLIEASFPPKGTIHTIKADTVPLIAIVKSKNDYIAQAFKLRGENKRNEALELAEKAVDFEPNNVEAQRIKGMLLIDLNQNDEAIRTLSKVISLNPDDFVAYTLAGIAYNRKKQYENAIRLFNKSIELKVNNTSGYLNRGRSYMALKNFNQALENFQEAAKYDNGRNPRIYVEASIALLQQGMANPQIKRNRFELAIRNMKLALEMNPNQKDVYRNLVFAYRELGDEANAARYQKMLQGN